MDPISILIRTTDLFCDLKFNNFSIKIKTNENLYTIEKANPWVWAVDNDTEKCNTKYVKHEDIITHFYRDYITRISIHKKGQEMYITLYDLMEK